MSDLSRFERRMAAPVACKCGWIGRLDELRSKGTEPAGQWHCPRCESLTLKFVEHEGTETVQ